MNSLNVSSLFYKGKLFQIGDLISCKVEFLNTSGAGFEHYNDGGILKSIEVTVDTVSNSCYLNHGFTYSTIGGLGYKFTFDKGSSQYAFESDIVHFPYLINDKIKYIDRYYDHEVNKDKCENLINYLNLPVNKKLGSYLKRYDREIFDYLCLTFRIRFGEFGLFKDNNELSNITFKILREFTNYDNNVKNKLHNLIANNKGVTDNSLYKNL
jgi:hypothetical protein